MKLLSMLSVAAILLSSAPVVQAQSPATQPLTIEELFPEKSHFGKSARNVAWSHNDRYFAYLWNPYEDKGWDIWLYDMRDGKSRRITSLEMFISFDRDMKPVAERYKTEKTEEERRKKLTEEERKKLEEDDKKKLEGQKEPKRDYIGVGEIAWANKSEELLFTYRGDIFRWKIGAEMPVRLTKTSENESSLKYSKDDSGFTFQRGSNLYRMRFDSPVLSQLNPDIPGVAGASFDLSPDESKLLIRASKTVGADRQVTYITYRERFAQARTTSRGVADDAFTTESTLYIYDLNDDPKANPKHDGKPWEVFKIPAGDEWGEFSLAADPWSPDSKKIAFATWYRNKREFQVHVAEIEGRKVTSVYRDTHSGEHRSPGLARPFFTRDGSKLVALMEKSGYRHAWIIDPLYAGASQLTRGDFEVYPDEISKDGNWLYVLSTKEHPSRMNLYRVDIKDGAMSRISARDGNYSNAVYSHDFKAVALSMRSWKQRPELFITSAERGGGEKAITASHPGTFEKIYKLQPELFQFKNRHGHTVNGFLFLPPGFKKTDKRPLMIYVYGGPLGTQKQVVDGASSLFEMYLAYQLGYVTCVIDPRGTSGYGGLFGGSNFEQPGRPQVEDLTDGVKYLTETYGLDSKKIGIHGWSFGGFQTQMCLYTAPDVFTLGIAGAGPTEWQNYNTWYTGGVIGKSRLGKPEDLDKYSLTYLAKGLKSPLLLLHGVEDTNVLFQDTIKVYQALLKAGKGPLVELVIDPTGGHGLEGDIKTKDRYLIYEAFLKKHWGTFVRAEDKKQGAN